MERLWLRARLTGALRHRGGRRCRHCWRRCARRSTADDPLTLRRAACCSRAASSAPGATPTRSRSSRRWPRNSATNDRCVQPRCRTGWAAAYTPVGRLSEGLLAQQRSYLLARELAGPLHPDTLRSVNNYANNLRQLGDNEARAALRARSVGGLQPALRPGSPRLASSRRATCRWCWAISGRPLESLQIIEPQIDAAGRAPGRDASADAEHPDPPRRAARPGRASRRGRARRRSADRTGHRGRSAKPAS